MDITALYELVNKGGVGALLLIIVVAGIKRYWVPGWLYRQILKERDEWKQLALRGSSLATRIINEKERNNND